MQDSTSGFIKQLPVIQISDAGIHHLKHLKLSLELGKVHLFLGLSGTGKSSLLRHTLYQAAQSRFAMGLGQYGGESKSTNTPIEAGQVDGIPPIIDVTKPPAISRRSTFGTLTGLHQMLQSLFVNYGNFQCPQCTEYLSVTQPFEIRLELLKLPAQTKVMIFAPLWEKSPDAAKSLIAQAGYVRIKYGTEVMDLQDFKTDQVGDKKELAAVVDRLIIKPGIENRLLESIEAAWKFSGGFCDIQYQADDESWRDLFYSAQYFCRGCKQHFSQIEQASLSFFAGQGACPKCHGLGEIEEPRSKTSNNKKSARNIKQNYRQLNICQACQGLRLGSAMHALHYGNRTFAQVLESSIIELETWMQILDKVFHSEHPGDQLRTEITSKICKLLQALDGLGIGYLSLKRSSNSLSTGEYQRAILARNSGKSIRETAFLFEEPGSGLHHLDIERLILHLKKLALNGNTLLISDPHPEFINIADEIWELGPAPGAGGGEIIFQGSKDEYLASKQTNGGVDNQHAIITALTSRLKNSRLNSFEELVLKDCHLHNLKHIDLSIRRNQWTSITGVSGSGKSSLVLECLVPHLKNYLGFSSNVLLSAEQGKLSNHEWIKGIRVITQDLLKKGDTANILTTLNLWGPVRLLYSRTKYARLNGWTPSFFSWKNPDFNCSYCRITRHQQPLDDHRNLCSSCLGTGINKAVLRAKYKDHHLADLLQLTCHEAIELFSNLHRFLAPLENMVALGLGYLTLGRRLKTLAQGELSRTHLSRELVTGEMELCLILDEPSAGLHQQECQMLVELLKQKQAAGHTILTIDHRYETIKHADVEIQMGPGAGEFGGEITQYRENSAL